MHINTEARAHEFAMAWINGASAGRARGTLERASKDQKWVAKSYKFSGHRVSAVTHLQIARILRTYARKLA
jgi:hypothetical protein